MAQSHERIFQRITQRFGIFPIKTYSKRILSNDNILFTDEDIMEYALNLNKTYIKLTQHVPIRR